jgi:mRNA interferase MazF
MESEQKITLQRGDVFLVNFNPTVGSEIQKIRPALILQNNTANKYSPLTIVAAISSYQEDENLYPVEVYIAKNSKTGLIKDSIILLNQIQTIDKQRIVKKLGCVELSIMEKVNKALQISFGIIRS